jgi:heat shock protein HtpX
MYQQIAANRRNSWLLVALFAALVIGLGYVIGEAWEIGPAGIALAAVLAVGMTLGAYFGGDQVLLKASGARLVEKADAPQLWNVVEELSIASGTPMPRLYVIDDTAPNAFATGRDPGHSSVAITSGLLQKLTRDELQGVMAHELSHVKNLDIRFAMLAGVLVGIVALLSDWFVRSLWWGGPRRRRSDRDGGAGAVFLIVGIVFAILAPVFARLLQLAISRQREYLADASAALMTRYPEGLACALEKIAGDREVLEAANRATQHLYIVNPIKPWEDRARSLFSTHPPVEERVRRLRTMGGGTVPAQEPPGAGGAGSAVSRS